MKKVLLIALGLVTAIGVQAQEENQSSGNKMFVGGTAGFASGGSSDKADETNDVNTSAYVFGPTFAYMLDDKMGVGINLTIDGSTNERQNATKDKTTMSGYNFEPFFRYYFAGTGNFKFYGDAALGFGGGNTKFEDNTGTNNESKYSTFSFMINPGVQYWFNDDWSMASTIGLLGYQTRTNNKGETDNNGNTKETVDSNFGIVGDFSTLRFSFFYHF